MTLSQLRTFALVARLGSLHAAAVALGVSEPAVSAALSALRHDLGDPLFVRASGGITLTPGGRALADYAQEIVGLADQARWEVVNAKTDAGRLKIAATAPFAEHAAGRLLDLFTKRVPGASVDVVAEAAEDLAGLLLERAYDIALGARPPAAAGASASVPGLVSVPFLRYQRVFVAAPADPLARVHGPLAPERLLGRPWFAGPAGVLESSDEGRWLADLGIALHAQIDVDRLDDLAFQHPAHGGADVVHAGRFGDEAGGAEFERAADRGRIVMGRDDDDRQRGVDAAQRHQSRQAADARHRQVEQDEVDVVALGDEGLDAVEVAELHYGAVFVEPAAQRPSKEGVVVRNDETISGCQFFPSRDPASENRRRRGSVAGILPFAVAFINARG